MLLALLNKLLLTALGYKFECRRLVAVDVEEEHVRPGNYFINDTTCVMKNHGTSMEAVPADVKELTQSEEDLIEKMQAIIHVFLNLLQVTGGALAP
jgi:hypothetical protein